MILSPATRVRLPERAIYGFRKNQYYYGLSEQPRISARTVAYSAEAGQQVITYPSAQFQGLALRFMLCIYFGVSIYLRCKSSN
jgi:hypothetical protein